ALELGLGRRVDVDPATGRLRIEVAPGPRPRVRRGRSPRGDLPADDPPSPAVALDLGSRPRRSAAARCRTGPGGPASPIRDARLLSPVPGWRSRVRAGPARATVRRSDTHLGRSDRCAPPERSAKLPGPPARTLRLEKPGWRPRSASAVGSARCAYPCPGGRGSHSSNRLPSGSVAQPNRP